MLVQEVQEGLSEKRRVEKGVAVTDDITKTYEHGKK
jgi:hypothetical protein